MKYFDEEIKLPESCMPQKENKSEIIDSDFFWSGLKAPKQKSIRKRDTITAVVITVLVLAALMSIAMTYIHGKGWVKNVFTRDGNISLTIPAASRPELEDEFYQSDGRYTVEGVAKAVSPSVVSLVTYSEKENYLEAGQGSGVILTKDGYIATNAHVVDGASKGIKVILSDGEEYQAKVMGSDSKSDLAVIKIAAKGLSPIQFGESSSVRLGEDVIAIGSPAGFYGTVTKGIVSGLDRKVKTQSDNYRMNCIQVDAAINNGNSGGALVNMWGQLVGIISSKMSSEKYEGIGFAISIDDAKPVLEDLIKYGYVNKSFKIGIAFYEVSEATASIYSMKPGLYIQKIEEDCDIAQSGLKTGDTITEINKKSVYSYSDVNAALDGCKAGDTVEAKVYRPAQKAGESDKTFEIKFKLMEDKTSVSEEK